MSSKVILFVASLSLSLLTACATTKPGSSLADAGTTPAAKPAAVTKPALVYVTGSRIPVPSSNGRAQSAAPTQTVGQQDISFTGQSNPGDALKMLTPAVTEKP